MFPYYILVGSIPKTAILTIIGKQVGRLRTNDTISLLGTLAIPVPCSSPALADLGSKIFLARPEATSTASKKS